MQVPHHLGRPYRLGPGTPECRRAGTDAAGAALPHLALHLIAPRAQRADVATQVETLADGPPSSPGPDHAFQGAGSRPPRSLLAETRGETSSQRSPAGFLRRPGTSN